MREERFFELLNDIDDGLIQEASENYPVEHLGKHLTQKGIVPLLYYKKVIAAILAIVILLGGVTGVYLHNESMRNHPVMLSQNDLQFLFETEALPPQSRAHYSKEYTSAVQKMLLNYNTSTREYLLSTGETSGIYGSGTEAAVKEFQSKENLMCDGVCGVSTWNALRAWTNRK